MSASFLYRSNGRQYGVRKSPYVQGVEYSAKISDAARKQEAYALKRMDWKNALADQKDADAASER